jgi:hypothetical protein
MTTIPYYASREMAGSPGIGAPSNFPLQRTTGLAMLARRPLSGAFAALAVDPACDVRRL